jgi:transposase
MTPDESARLALLEERDKAFERRLNIVEKVVESVHAIAADVKVLTLQVKALAENLEKSILNNENEHKEIEESTDTRFKAQGERIGTLDGKSGKKWDAAVSHLTMLALGAVAMWLFKQIGL